MTNEIEAGLLTSYSKDMTQVMFGDKYANILRNELLNDDKLYLFSILRSTSTTPRKLVKNH